MQSLVETKQEFKESKVVSKSDALHREFMVNFGRINAIDDSKNDGLFFVEFYGVTSHDMGKVYKKVFYAEDCELIKQRQSLKFESIENHLIMNTILYSLSMENSEFDIEYQRIKIDYEDFLRIIIKSEYGDIKLNIPGILNTVNDIVNQRKSVIQFLQDKPLSNNNLYRFRNCGLLLENMENNCLALKEDYTRFIDSMIKDWESKDKENKNENTPPKTIFQQLNDIKMQFDVNKYTTQNARHLLKTLETYENIKHTIDKDVLLYTIQKKVNKNLNSVLMENKESIDQLTGKFYKIRDTIFDISAEALKCTQCNNAIQNMEVNNGDALDECLHGYGFENLDEIQTKSKDTRRMWTKNKQKLKNTAKEIKELAKTNSEMRKYIIEERKVALLCPDLYIKYRTDQRCVITDMERIKNKLERKGKYVFTDTILLHDVYKALETIHNGKLKTEHDTDDDDPVNISCREYINDVDKQLKIYLKEYGNDLISHLNYLLDICLPSHDMSECGIKNSQWKNKINYAVYDIKECLSILNEISCFDTKMDSESRQQIQVLTYLFDNNFFDSNSIQRYIHYVMLKFKNNIQIMYESCKVSCQPKKIGILQYICQCMSVIDMFLLDENKFKYLALTMGAYILKTVGL